MIDFANPQYLYLLLLLPVVAALFLLSRRARLRDLKSFGRQQQVEGLMPDASRYKPWIRLTLELLLIAAVVLILARPRGGARVTSSTVHGVEVMVAVDVSNSMDAAADDNMPEISRLQRSKMLLQKLIDRLQGNKVGLIVFAGNAYMQMPLTGDPESAKMFLGDISTSMVPTQGTAIGGAIQMATNAFSKNPHVQKSIIIITDGENFEDDAQGAATAARKNGIQINVVGIGSTKGSPIPAENGQMMTDEQGQQVLTKLDEKTAQAIANAGHGIYVNGASDEAVDALHQSLQQLSKSDLGTVSYTKHDEQFPVFAWMALLLIVAGMILLDRKTPWLKNRNFFTNDTKK